MPEKTKLSPDLDSLEKLLIRTTIPVANIDRDATMYRSGWEAATAEFEANSVSRHNPTPMQKWVWPTTTVIATAAAAIFGMMLFLQTGSSDSESVRGIAAGPGPAKVEQAEQPAVEPLDSNPTDLKSDLELKTDLLKLVMEFHGKQPLDSGFALQPTTELSANDDSVDSQLFPSEGSNKTNRQLMDELAPRAKSEKTKWTTLRLLRKS